MPSDLGGDASGGHRGSVTRWCRTNVKGDLGVPLVVLRLKVLEDRHLLDQPKREGREVIGPLLGGGHHKDVLFGIKEQLVAYEGRGDPRLTDPSECLDAETPWPILQVVRYVILDWGGLRKPELIPSEVEEVSEVMQTVIHGSLPGAPTATAAIAAAATTTSVAGDQCGATYGVTKSTCGSALERIRNNPPLALNKAGDVSGGCFRLCLLDEQRGAPVWTDLCVSDLGLLLWGNGETHGLTYRSDWG